MSTAAAPLRGPLPAPTVRPISSAERIMSIDVLRGFALLGILILNIQSFAMPGAAYLNPTAYGDFTGANYWVWYLSHVLADQKLMSIFSMLFGAGIIVMTSRSEQRTGRSAGVHYRRMGWLILFGLLHAHLLWYGDILYSYGMCGLVAYFFRTCKPMTLIIVGVLAFCVPVVLNLGSYFMFHALPEDGRAAWQQAIEPMWQPTAAELQLELDAYRGGYLDQQFDRSTMSALFETVVFALYIAWRVLGLMLIGMALLKLGVFSAVRSYATYAVMAIVGVGLGVVLSAIEVTLHEAHNWAAIDSMYLFSQLHYVSTFFHALGYVGGVMLLCKSGALMLLQRALAAVGRMAFSNYLLQTIICTTTCYGHGFGLFGSLTRVEQIGIWAAVSVAQLVWSPLWLSVFRFGPAEWLWRTLTYWRWQPMLRSSTAIDSAAPASA